MTEPSVRAAGERIRALYGDAEKRFREAAAQGYSEGQYRLGNLELGREEFDEAIRSYESAAGQAHVGA